MIAIAEIFATPFRKTMAHRGTLAGLLAFALPVLPLTNAFAGNLKAMAVKTDIGGFQLNSLLLEPVGEPDLPPISGYRRDLREIARGVESRIAGDGE